MKNKHVFLVGAHMSIAGSIENAILAGESIGCTCVQFFTHNNRQWSIPVLQEESIARFKKTEAASSILVSMVHASYLLNIGSSNADLLRRSTQSLIEELDFCSRLGVPYLIIHPGSYGDSSPRDCISRIIEQLNIALDQIKSDTTILIENTAGQGSAIGSKFEELASILEGVTHKKRIGVCFDTCHAFAAGYDFRTQHTYDALWETFDKIIGINYLKAIHLNDSKKDLGSRVDRHEHIGKGKMGLAPFTLLCNDERFFDIPKVIETPKEDSLQLDLQNMQLLKSLLSPKNHALLVSHHNK